MKNKAKKISDVIPKAERGSDQRPESCNCQGKLGERIAMRSDAAVAKVVIKLVAGEKKSINRTQWC
jgi:hypothetical protein